MTQHTQKHTPTPYSLCGTTIKGSSSYRIIDRNGAVICLLKSAHGNKIENGQFIVRACNAHDDGVRFVDRFNQLIHTYTPSGMPSHPTDDELRELIKLAESFSTKARGEA
jgi:hypothetical protein